MNGIIEIIGYLAGACVATSLFPQMYKTIKTKDTRGISLAMYCIYFVGVILFVIYGIGIKSIPVAVTNAVAMFPAGIILFMKIKNTKKDSTQQ